MHVGCRDWRRSTKGAWGHTLQSSVYGCLIAICRTFGIDLWHLMRRGYVITLHNLNGNKSDGLGLMWVLQKNTKTLLNRKGDGDSLLRFTTNNFCRLLTKWRKDNTAILCNTPISTERSIAHSTTCVPIAAIKPHKSVRNRHYHVMLSPKSDNLLHVFFFLLLLNIILSVMPHGLIFLLVY